MPGKEGHPTASSLKVQTQEKHLGEVTNEMAGWTVSKSGQALQQTLATSQDKIRAGKISA